MIVFQSLPMRRLRESRRQLTDDLKIGILESTQTREQRRFHRYAVNLNCLVKLKGGRKAKALPEITAETKDVSSGGFFFVTSGEWKLGTELDCTLRLPIKAFGGQPVEIRCRGKVTRIVLQEGGGMGIGATIEHYEFTRINDNSKSEERIETISEPTPKTAAKNRPMSVS
jgi:hypothetical protein